MYLPEKSEDQVWLGVLIAVPQPWDELLTEVRLQLGDCSAHRVPPHITLVPPIAVHTSLKEDVIRHLRSVASRFRPFRIKLGSVQSFLPVSPVMYLGLREGAESCRDLADEIRGGPLSYTPRFEYHPHVTLSTEATHSDLAKARELIDGLDADWTAQGFRLDRVSADGAYSSTAIFDFAL